MRVTLEGKWEQLQENKVGLLLVSPLPCSDQSFEVGKPSKPKGKVLKLPPELEKKFSPQMMPRLGPPSRPMFPPQHAQPPPAYYQYMRQVSVEPPPPPLPPPSSSPTVISPAALSFIRCSRLSLANPCLRTWCTVTPTHLPACHHPIQGTTCPLCMRDHQTCTLGTLQRVLPTSLPTGTENASPSLLCSLHD